MEPRTLNNTNFEDAKRMVSDLEKFGDGDAWLLICKARSKKQAWMKSTKAMAILGLGVIVQVTTRERDSIAEALQFIPGASIYEWHDAGNKVTSRSIKADLSSPGRVVSPFCNEEEDDC